MQVTNLLHQKDYYIRLFQHSSVTLMPCHLYTYDVFSSFFSSWHRCRIVDRRHRNLFTQTSCHVNCLSTKHPRRFKLWKYDLIFIIFRKSITVRLGNQKLFYFPTLNGVSALPGETKTTGNASFQLNTVCCFAKKTRKTQHIEIITRSH